MSAQTARRSVTPQSNVVTRAIVFVLTIAAAQAQAQEIETYRSKNQASILAEFRELLSIPNVSSDRAGIDRTAQKVMAMMKARGIAPELLEAEGSAPAVFGELRTPGAKRTLMFYAHYDGQPVDPANWSTPPFTPVLKDENGKELSWEKAGEAPAGARIYARSASDDKAAILALMIALDAVRATGKKLGANLKFFFEGEEEAGSPHLRALLEKHKKRLTADLWLMCDGPIHQSGRPMVFFGVRGVIGMELTVYGPIRGLHSGHYGNWAPNPVVTLAHLIAGLRAENGQIAIDQFYDDVRPLTAREKSALEKIPAVEARLMQELQIVAPENTKKPLVELITQPALNLRGVIGGTSGDKAANAIPVEASASIDFRLVPNQTPDGVKKRFEQHLARAGFHVVAETPDKKTRLAHAKIARVVWGSGYSPSRTDMDLPIVREAVAKIRAAEPELLELPTLGGSLPFHHFSDVLKAPLLGLPIANHDNNQHAANENIRLRELNRGIAVFASLMMAQ